MVTVKASSLFQLASPKAAAAAICRVTAWIEDFTAGKAILSLSVRSATLLTFGFLVLRYNGMVLSEAMPLYSCLPRLLAQAKISGATPPAAICNFSVLSASVIIGPPEIACQVTLI